MKVKCISQCQQDRKKIYTVGSIYDIEEKMYKKNTEFFKVIEKKENKE